MLMYYKKDEQRNTKIHRQKEGCTVKKTARQWDVEIDGLTCNLTDGLNNRQTFNQKFG